MWKGSRIKRFTDGGIGHINNQISKMKHKGYLIRVKETEKLPICEMGCAICGEHKPLYAVGFHKEETNLCKECMPEYAKGEKDEL